ncbi:MAG: ATP-binding protein [Gammaproteobacteria bacterium]
MNLYSPMATGAVARDAQVRREQIETLLLQGLSGAVATLLVSAVYVLAVWEFEARVHLAAWFAVGLVLGSVRIWFAWRVRNQGVPARTTRTWSSLAIAFGAAAGAQWGYASLMFVPAGTGGLYFLLAAMLVGMPAGAILSFGVYVPAYAAYLACSVLPFSAGFALAEDPHFRLAGAAGFVLGFYLLRTSMVNAGVLRRNIQQRLELEALTGSLAQARDAAESANRAKSSFLANMSHELRTPLNAVVGLSELLQQTSDNPKAIGHAATIRKSALSLLELIDDVLDLSRIEAGGTSLRPKIFELPELLRDIAAMFAPVAERQGLSFTLRLAEDLPPRVEADPARLRQVLVNLLGNAMKFTPNGEVRLTASVDEQVSAEARVRFAVADTGVGIDTAVQATLFRPFVQGHAGDEAQTRRGTGLGLAITAELVELMQGVLEVDSAPGRGSTFTMVLPLRIAPAYTAPAANDATAQALGPCRVLLVEDNEVNQIVASEMLLALGCEVRIADSGQAALVELMAERYDLVLMDCMMPGMSGFETTSAWRTHERLHGGHVPIVALTANAIAGDRESCLAAGMDDYLTKPVSLQRLREVITRYGRET